MSEEQKQAELLADVLRELLRALDVPETEAVRKVVRELLTQASGGAVSGVSSTLAEEARRSFGAGDGV